MQSDKIHTRKGEPAIQSKTSTWLAVALNLVNVLSLLKIERKSGKFKLPVTSKTTLRKRASGLIQWWALMAWNYFNNTNKFYVMSFLEPRPCEAAHCLSVPYSTCFMYSGKRLCKCVQSCALDLGKVCGTDGVTYQNECEMRKAACSSKRQINIYKRHPCG